MTSTLSRTNSVAISMKRSLCPLRPPILQRDGATLDPAEFAQPLHQGGDPLALDRRSCGTQVTDGRHFRRLLRPRHDRPSHRAAEQRDELAPLHVWMAPAWQEKIERAAQKSLAVMCPACSRSLDGLLALMESANRGLITRAGSMSQ